MEVAILAILAVVVAASLGLNAFQTVLFMRQQKQFIELVLIEQKERTVYLEKAAKKLDQELEKDEQAVDEKTAAFFPEARAKNWRPPEFCEGNSRLKVYPVDKQIEDLKATMEANEEIG